MPSTNLSLPTGTLTTAGTFTVGDDETTGFVVSCTSEEIRALSSVPMYRRVALVPVDMVDDCTVRATDYERLANAALALRAACKDRISPGHYAKLDVECRELDAILSPGKTVENPSDIPDTSPTITVHDGNGSNPQKLTKVQYDALCASGMLWEFHPDAPQCWPHP